MSVPQKLRIWLLRALIGLFVGLIVVWGMPERESPAPQPRLAPVETGAEPIVSYADAIERAQSSVVSIYTNTTVRQPLNPLFDDPFFQQFMPRRELQQTSLGSGVILDDQGHVLTNAHVIRSADSIVAITFNGQERSADCWAKTGTAIWQCLKSMMRGCGPFRSILTTAPGLGMWFLLSVIPSVLARRFQWASFRRRVGTNPA